MGNPEMKKCFICRKKISLVEQTITCRCDHVFCNSHRQPELHNCEFNFKDFGVKELEKKLLQGKPLQEKLEAF